MVPNSQWGSLVNGISMPWNRAIFVAISADSTGSRSSQVFSGRLCTQEPIRVVRGLGLEGEGVGNGGGGDVRVWGQEVPRGGQGRAGLGSYWDVLFQPALWEDSVELRPERPLCQDGEHHTFEDQGVHALQEDGQPRGRVTRGRRPTQERLL